MKPSKPIIRLIYWSLAAAWTAVIYLTLPYAPVWRDWLIERFTPYFFPVTVLTVITIVLFITLLKMIKRKSPFWDYLFLLLIAAAYVYSLIRIKIVVEQVHFLEYGLLAILVINALRFDRKEPAQYLNALLLVSFAGIVDEYIQGLLVNRVGELRDIYLNLLAAALALVWFRICLKPPEIPKSNWKPALRLTFPIMALIVLALGIFNSRISEFGYYIENPLIGAFYSRFPPQRLLNDLPEVEKFRDEMLPLLYREDYATLLKVVKIPVHAEALVHLFRRDVRLKRDRDFQVAHRENQILEKYFNPYIAGTEHQWLPDKTTLIAQAAAADTLNPYVSPVSQQIITAFSEKAQWTAIVLLEILFITGWLLLFRKNRLPEHRGN